MKSRKAFAVSYIWAGLAYTLTQTFKSRREAVKCAYGLVNAGFPAQVRRVK